jgi:F-type H+-transporting ATPase subunit delta
MKASRQTTREARQMFRLCLANGLLDEGRVRKMVQQIIGARPRGYLVTLSLFRRLVKLDTDRHSARVESAQSLPADLQGRVQSGLTRIYGPGLSYSFAANSALIGGMRIRVGSDVYDGSIQARLAALQQSF